MSKGKMSPSIKLTSMKNDNFNVFFLLFFRFDGPMTFYWRLQTGFQVRTGTEREYTVK